MLTPTSAKTRDAYIEGEDALSPDAALCGEAGLSTWNPVNAVRH